MGADLPVHCIDDVAAAGCDDFCDKLIPELYEEVKKQKMEHTNFDGDSVIGALSSDGWKKKAAGQGTPLINFNFLLPNGGSFFYKIVPARGVVKNAGWIVETTEAVIKEVTGNKPHRLTGGFLGCLVSAAEVVG